MAFIFGDDQDNVNLRGTRSDDDINALAGNDVIRAGAGSDQIHGGTGDDLMFGGVGADVFSFFVDNIEGDSFNGNVDYIADFDLRQGDSLFFEAIGEGQEIIIDSVTRIQTETGTVNGVDAQNNAGSFDVIFTIRDSVSGATQEIVLLDSWSGAMAGAWDDYLASLGVSWDFGPEPALA
ncbi:MAG: calcium-binding protein [Paracoccaceae bacterium]